MTLRKGNQPGPNASRSARISDRTSRVASRALRRSSIAWALLRPCFHRALRDRSSPSGVLGPVLSPPCIRQRPLGIAGPLQGVPRRVLAPHRLAFRKSPGGLPFLSQPSFGTTGAALLRFVWASLVICAHHPGPSFSPRSPLSSSRLRRLASHPAPERSGGCG
jgi:hypothetical protein